MSTASDGSHKLSSSSVLSPRYSNLLLVKYDVQLIAWEGERRTWGHLWLSQKGFVLSLARLALPLAGLSTWKGINSETAAGAGVVLSTSAANLVRRPSSRLTGARGLGPVKPALCFVCLSDKRFDKLATQLKLERAKSLVFRVST